MPRRQSLPVGAARRKERKTTRKFSHFLTPSSRGGLLFGGAPAKKQRRIFTLLFSLGGDLTATYQKIPGGEADRGVSVEG
jgi:hypothetical protein